MLSCVKIANLNRDANSATSVFSDTMSLTVNPVKSRRKLVEQDRLLYGRSQNVWVAHSRIQSRRRAAEVQVDFLEEHNIHGNRSHRSNLIRHVTPHQNQRKKGSIARSCSKSVNFKKRNPCAPKFEDRTLQDTLQQERCGRKAWDLAQSVCKLKTKDKATFYSLAKAWAMPAPSSKKAAGFRSFDARAWQKGFGLREVHRKQIQKCQHSQTLLMTEIRNVLRK